MLRLADEVAQPVGEVFSVSGGGDVVPCGLVQVAQGYAGPQHGLRQLVGLPHQVVDGGVLGIRRPAEEGPGHVGAVAVLPAAHVNDDAVPSLQAGLVRLVVGVRGVGAVGDDGQERSGVTALGGVLGMIAPPTNIPAMIIGAGIDIPYSGFGLPLTMLTFPLAFLFVLMFGYKYVKNMNYVEVEAKLNTDSRKRFGFKVYIPLLLAIVLMVLNKAVPAIPDIGMPLVFLISAVVGCFTGYKFNFFKAAKESVHSALPVMGILMGVGMFIQVMTLTGVRGLIVTSCLSLPSFARYLALAISMPAFGAISSFGSASVLGVPFLLSFLAKDQIIVAAALSLVASLGDMVPPTALAGIFAAKVVGMENYTPILKKCLIPCLIVVIWAILFIVFADQLSFLTLS